MNVTLSLVLGEVERWAIGVVHLGMAGAGLSQQN